MSRIENRRRSIVDQHGPVVGGLVVQYFFHVTTAYALLRHSGVEVGKKDYMGV